MHAARDLLAAAVSLQPDTVALRRRLHRRPEIGLMLPQTIRARSLGDNGAQPAEPAST